MRNYSYILNSLVSVLDSGAKTFRAFHQDSLAKAIETSIDSISNPMQLAIIGRISSSKSTLVNAILGEDGIVATNQMEETYNVCWIKYGCADSDVKVVYKDGRSEFVPRSEWFRWSGHEASVLKQGVQYVEIKFPHEILKDINIIDTPGLDSTKGVDSQNTIDFLQQVKPDAVVMLFTKAAIADSTLQILNAFKNVGVTNFTLSPLNAVGLYAKIDELWKSTSSNLPIDLSKDVINRNLYDRFPELRSSFYTILPICSLLALAYSTLDDDDLYSLKKLAIDDNLNELFESANDFVDDYYKTSISIDERERLLEKFGLYGVYELTKKIQGGVNDLLLLQKHLCNISGYAGFLNLLYSHFGERAALIKTQGALGYILSELKRVQDSSTGDLLSAAREFEIELQQTLSSMHEYREMSFLTKIYDGRAQYLDQSAIEVFKRLAGEYGESIADKIGANSNSDLRTILEIAIHESSVWKQKYMLSKLRAPQNAELYKLISDTYTILGERIKEYRKKQFEAQKEVLLINQYFYGYNDDSRN